MNDNQRVRKRSNFDSHSKYQPPAKKFKSNEFLNFADSPKPIFYNLKIPRKTEEYQSIPVISSVNTYSSSIPPPFPLLDDNLPNFDDPVTKAVLDNVTGRFNKSSAKLQYFRCRECNLFMSGQASLDTHLAGSRHAKKLKELEMSSVVDSLKKERVSKLSETEYRCKLCDVKSGSLVQIKSHIDGSKHKKKIIAYREAKTKKQQSSIDEAGNSDLEKTVSTTMENDDIDRSNANNATNKKNKPIQSFHCNICGLSMNSQLQYDQHTSSKKHNAKAAKLSNAGQVVSTHIHSNSSLETNVIPVETSTTC